MPNKPARNKRRGVRIVATRVAKPLHAADSVKDVLARLNPALKRVAEQPSLETFWREWLAEHLPQEWIPHLSSIAERDGSLTLFAESAAWAARLRYALHELEPKIRELKSVIQRVTVRVLPAKPSARASRP